MQIIRKLKQLAHNTRGALSAGWLVMISVGLLLVGVLAPVGLAAIEAYVPTDPTVLIVWPLVGVFACIGIAYQFLGPIVNRN